MTQSNSIKSYVEFANENGGFLQQGRELSSLSNRGWKNHNGHKQYSVVS